MDFHAGIYGHMQWMNGRLRSKSYTSWLYNFRLVATAGIVMLHCADFRPNMVAAYHQGPLLQTWINFNPSMDT